MRKEPSYNFKSRCYEVDKPYWGRGKRYVYDRLQGKVVPMEERTDAPPADMKNIISWKTEWTYLSTGKRMTQRQLKEYCKINGKIWENG